MSDKPIAVLLAAAVVVPLCAVCAFGPAVFTVGAVWVSGIFAGFSPMVTIGLALFAGLALYGLFSRWGATTERGRSEV